jgi:DNA-binding XRE family transcriptional regulator
MTTVAADALGEPDEQGKRNSNETITRTVRALRSAHQIDASELARHLGISRQSFYNRLNGAPWLASEVAALADYFGVGVEDLYSGAVNLTRPLTTRTTAPPDPGVTAPVTPRISRVCSAHALADVIPFPARRAVRPGRCGTHSGPSRPARVAVAA